MAGFSNIAVHVDQNHDLDAIQYVIEEKLKDLLSFSKTGIHTQSL